MQLVEQHGHGAVDVLRAILMADRTRSIPDICRELDDMPSSTLYHYLHADGTLKDPGLPPPRQQRFPATPSGRPAVTHLRGGDPPRRR
ncbi:MAG: hypothetical protein OXU77_20930 [Gammaproteobacteria bacterium]|nr:hypothetical protein [Gammaproteobacteria bacterium]MDE0442423.1 hypothetical protein [Gammaproteobacteria bacterium]